MYIYIYVCIGICMYVYVRICMNIHIHIHTPIHLYMRISSEVADEIPAHRRQTPDLQWAGRGGVTTWKLKGAASAAIVIYVPPISVRFCGREPNVCWGIREPEQPLAHNIHTFHFCASKRHRFVSRSWQLRASSRFETRVCVCGEEASLSLFRAR